MRCAKCRSDNAPDSKYCGSCGHLLAEPVAAEAPAPGVPEALATGERRQATIMFSDISDYTAITERLDPETVNEVLSLTRQAAASVVGKHGGTINQFIGDEVMAVFGIPSAQEDDPVRAIRAALELHAEIRERTGDLQAQTGERIAIHTGINTGLILAQYRNDREGLYQLTGEAINTTARLRSLAKPDEVLIGPNTYRLIKPYFEVEAQPLVSVKGKALPIVPYRVLAASRVRSRFEAAQERGFVGYVGRARELETMRGCRARALAGDGQLITIEGEPGIGKSRLLHEFCQDLDRERITVTQSWCQSHASDTAYFPFLDGLRRSLQLSEHDSHADALRTVVSNVQRIDPVLEKSLPLLLHLLSIPSDYALPPDLQGEALRRAVGEALVATLTLTAKTKPMVLVIEDWHWSDPSSQAALRHLLRLLPSYRLMVLVSYRPGHSFDFGALSDHTAIHLNPLSETEAEDLIRTVTGTEAVPAGLSALIGQNAGGNPLFVEEACYSLLEAGAVSVGDRRLILLQPLEQLLLPDTVQAVIRARLDRLDESSQAVVGLASVIGRVFSERILARIHRGRTSLEEALQVLQAQEIIRQTTILPEPEYSFRHVLTREVAYDTLLHQQRRQLHEAVGLAIEAQYPSRLVENASILAYHYARSPRADKAVHYALLAGDRAARLYANAEATTCFEDALTVARAAPKAPETQRWQIDAILGQASVGITPRNMERHRQNLEEARAFAEALHDQRRLAQVLYWLGRHHYVLAQLELAIKFARRSLEIADELDDAALAAPPVNLMGRAYWQLSDFVRSAEMMERSVEQMRSVGNKSEEATAAGFLSGLLAYMGDFDKALASCDRSITLAQELKNPYTEAATLHYRGIIRDQQGQWESAIADYAAARKIAETAGDLFRVYLIKFMEGHAYHIAGDRGRGRALIEESIALATQLGTTFLLGQAKTLLAACGLADGEGADEWARSLCAEAIALAEKAGDKFTAALALRALAESLSRSGSPEEQDKARHMIRDALRMLEEIGAKPELGRSYVSLASILKAEGHTLEAEAALQKAMGLFGQLGMEWDMAWATHALDDSSGGR